VLEIVSVCVLAFTLIPALGLVGAGLAIALPAFLTRGVAPLIQGCRVVGVSVSHYVGHIIVPSLLCGVLPAAAIGAAVAFYPPANWALLAAYSLAYAALFAACYAAMMGKARVRAAYAEVTAMLRRRRAESPVGGT
jgi:hypothetical protein